MIISVHESRPDGSPGPLFTTVEREPKYRKSTRRDWVMFDGDWFPVITGFDSSMIVVPADRLEMAKIIEKGGRVKR